jgi:hypothetical protein
MLSLPRCTTRDVLSLVRHFGTLPGPGDAGSDRAFSGSQLLPLSERPGLPLSGAPNEALNEPPVRWRHCHAPPEDVGRLLSMGSVSPSAATGRARARAPTDMAVARPSLARRRRGPPASRHLAERSRPRARRRFPRPEGTNDQGPSGLLIVPDSYSTLTVMQFLCERCPYIAGCLQVPQVHVGLICCHCAPSRPDPGPILRYGGQRVRRIVRIIALS